MLTSEKLREIRKKAQDAVSDMSETELRTKAFEVFLQHLLASESPGRLIVNEPLSRITHEKSRLSKTAGSTKTRILLLRDEGFFAVPRSMSEIKSELQAHGWIHPLTALSGPLQALVRERELRRIKDHGAKQKVWKYVNP
ncbi:hypothetical protein L0337_38920 [candidate division KSB1 bacterium]|nr:hypothetical protein [candidate division KSB1 bacterium]